MATSTAHWHGGEARSGPWVHATGGAERRWRRLERLAWIMDRSIPIGRWRIGLDPILGLIPGLGDWVGAVLSLYVLYEGARLGVRGGVLARMTGNILVETIVGAIPVLGDLFDFAWQANTRNLALLRRHYQPGLAPRSLRRVLLTVGAAAFAVLLLIGALAYFFVRAIVGLWNG